MEATRVEPGAATEDLQRIRPLLRKMLFNNLQKENQEASMQKLFKTKIYWKNYWRANSKLLVEVNKNEKLPEESEIIVKRAEIDLNSV